MKSIVKELFCESNAVSTRDVARAFEIGENEARSWAEEIGVARIGASFAWTLPDVEELAQQLEDLEAQEEDEEPPEDVEEDDDLDGEEHDDDDDDDDDE